MTTKMENSVSILGVISLRKLMAYAIDWHII